MIILLVLLAAVTYFDPMDYRHHPPANNNVCFNDAMAEVARLQPAASEAAGRNLPVQVVLGFPQFASEIMSDRDLPAHREGINIAIEEAQFCALAPAQKEQVLAHEFGHIVFEALRGHVEENRFNEFQIEASANYYQERVLQLANGAMPFFQNQINGGLR